METTRFPQGIPDSSLRDAEDRLDPLSSKNISIDDPQDEDLRPYKFTDVSVEDSTQTEKHYKIFDTSKTVSDLAQVIYESSTPTVKKSKAMVNKLSLGFTASVSNAQIISNILTGYVEYTISVRFIQGKDSKGNFETIRRFSDFDLLRELLVTRWPGCYIPCLPHKQIIGNTDQAFVEHRRKYLETFLQAAINLHYIYETEEFLQFLRGPENYKESTRLLALPSFPVILNSYLNSFAAYSSIVMTDSMRETISEYENKFRGASNLLSMLDENIRTVANNFRCYKMDLIEMLQLQNEFENTYLREYKNDVRSSFSIEKADSLSEIPDPIYGFREWVECEQFEYSAMIQLLRSRSSLLEWKETLSSRLIDLEDSKLSKMKEWLTKIKNINTNDGYDTEERIQEAIEAIDKIETIVSSRILNYEIPIFRQDRKQNFTSTMQKLYSAFGTESVKVLNIANEIMQKLE